MCYKTCLYTTRLHSIARLQTAEYIAEGRMVGSVSWVSYRLSPHFRRIVRSMMEILISFVILLILGDKWEFPGEPVSLYFLSRFVYSMKALPVREISSIGTYFHFPCEFTVFPRPTTGRKLRIQSSPKAEIEFLFLSLTFPFPTQRLLDQLSRYPPKVKQSHSVVQG